jgi:hypothetical protein
MTMTLASTSSATGSNDFAFQVRQTLLRNRHTPNCKGPKTIRELARLLNYSRNSVSLAINHGLFVDLREEIKKELRIK